MYTRRKLSTIQLAMCNYLAIRFLHEMNSLMCQVSTRNEQRLRQAATTSLLSGSEIKEKKICEIRILCLSYGR